MQTSCNVCVSMATFRGPLKTEENRVWNRIFFFPKLIINSSLLCSQAVIKAANPYVGVQAEAGVQAEQASVAVAFFGISVQIRFWQKL